MARKQADVFGFDELAAAFDRVGKRYAVESDALLMAQAVQVTKRARQLTPKISGNLKKDWRYLKPKEYQGGKVKVALVRNRAPHAHLVEYGHEMYTTGYRKKTGRKKTGKVNRYNAVGRRVKGIKKHDRVEGKYILDQSIREMESRFPREAEKMLDKITEGVTVD